jgi:hypothetical protein
MKAREDFCVDDYIFRYGKVSQKQREQMVQLIIDLNAEKGYNQETLHLAVSIADRYLNALC